MRLFLTTALATALIAPAYAESSKNAYEERIYLDDLRQINESEGNNNASIPSNKQEIPSSFPKKEKYLKPRVEGNWRYSNDRSILMSEFWMPLAQNEQDGSVLFGDVRLMGDNNSNKEFNLGVGYRELVNNKLLSDGIAGGMIWYDRRHTKRGSKFNQITAGLEWLGEQYDVRLNGYVPLNTSKSFTQGNTSNSALGFVGNQILVNTDQSVVEESLPGLDLELGYKLDFMDGITDVTRVYAGGYHFQGDKVESVTGWRARIASDITSDVQIGARFQRDDVRGSQAYLEATVRFPFGNKKSFKTEGLRSRLDESPERDIDIVSNEVVTEDGINQLILNARTGNAQNVIHVDNTAGAGGDGSAENPFNTLAGAEAVAIANDLIYVNRGDGTSAGQGAGITLDEEGQMLIGSGVNLIYDTNRFRTSNNRNVQDGIIVRTKTAAPVITNATGNGVDISADNTFVSGVVVDNTFNTGIKVTGNDAVIDNVIASNNPNYGIDFRADNASINSGTVLNSITNNNGGGVIFSAEAGFNIGSVTIENSITNENSNDGVLVRSFTGSNIDQVQLKNNISSDNIRDGLALSSAAGGVINEALINSNQVRSNGNMGVRVGASSGGNISALSISDNASENNSVDGYVIQVTGAGSRTLNADFSNNFANANGRYGFYTIVQNNGIIGLAKLQSNTASNNAQFGFIHQAIGVGSALDVSLSDNIADTNESDGFYIFAQTGGIINQATVTRNTARNNTRNGFLIFSANAGSDLNANLINNNAFNNDLAGFATDAQFTGVISQANFTGNIAQNNNDGFSFATSTDGSILQSQISANTATNNSLNGVRFTDGSIAGGILADMGGGVFGAAGGNQIYDNMLRDLLIDLDGAELKAENNWWGTASGLLSTAVLLQGGQLLMQAHF